ncbi:hypothetical protein [Aeromonas bestiarum]|uniref:Uncharacterized protein n=1 Tax=Aeromonas bestiarum TaxID=105751 RepID=A0ABT7PV53_9GAMM|nr:hypothetical protein [Aeromonas bestiarum]MDM5070813.1 hypothetical protein [Aeromonas bestiarum]
MSTSSTLKLALELAAKVTGREDLAALAGQLETALADVAIPRAITTLGSDFQQGQAVNGIWVSGGHQGISARVVRQGTAGEQLAQSITHPLVCDVAAARAQGVVGLAKTMPKRTQTIELPLSADTGLILSGALLVVDGCKDYNRGVRVPAAVTAMTSTTPPGYVGGGHRHSARCRGSHRQEGILQGRGAGRRGAGLTDL